MRHVPQSAVKLPYEKFVAVHLGLFPGVFHALPAFESGIRALRRLAPASPPISRAAVQTGSRAHARVGLDALFSKANLKAFQSVGHQQTKATFMDPKFSRGVCRVVKTFPLFGERRPVIIIHVAEVNFRQKSID